MNRTSYPKHRDGFTLIELLVAMAVIAILAAITLQVAGSTSAAAAEKKAMAQMKQIEMLVEEFLGERGAYPTNSDDLISWFTNKYDNVDVGTLKVVNGDFQDPWGGEWDYSKVNDNVYSVFSEGPDGKSGNSNERADDIRSRGGR